MGDERVPLPDVDTSNPTVVSRYQQWIEAFVKEYSIDGLRIDGEQAAISNEFHDRAWASRKTCQGRVLVKILWKRWCILHGRGLWRSTC